MATFADKPTITGKRVVLRPMTIDDAEPFLASMDDEGHRLTGTHRAFTLPDVQAWAGSRADQDDRLDLTIVDRASGEWAGELAVNDWDEQNQSCGFRIALAPGFRDRGVGSEATRLIVDYVFEALPIHRISLEVFEFNPRAIHVYERAGFVREGVQRDALRWDGEFHDAITMSILRPDWLAAGRSA